MFGAGKKQNGNSTRELLQQLKNLERAQQSPFSTQISDLPVKAKLLKSLTFQPVYAYQNGNDLSYLAAYFIKIELPVKFLYKYPAKIWDGFTS